MEVPCGKRLNIMIKGHTFLLSALLTLLVSCSGDKVKEYTLEVVAEYPHDVNSYTQGLFFHEGKLYESTGVYGKSTFRIVNLQDGKAEKRLDFDKKYFVEGSVILGDKLYVLTWQNKAAFIYDAATLEYQTAVKYPREGWGLTTDGTQLIASDGSSRLFFMDADMKLLKRVNVKIGERPVPYLNELEWIDGEIWANVYTTDDILVINPKDGKVKAVIDCEGLLDKVLRTPDTDVLNGIAYDKASGKIYLTGKNWPKMFEVRLVKKKS